MLIPVKNRSIQLFNFSIGQQNDNNIEHLVFEIPRFYGGVDLSDGIIYALFQYPSKTTDYTVLKKEVQETKILATWVVGKSVLSENGVLNFQLKISNLVSEIWHSERAYFNVNASIAVETPEPVSRKARMSNIDTEPPITVSERNIHIPSALRNIAVQNDQNSETVGILMPRYFDGHDLSRYSIVLKTISIGGRDDIVLFPTSITENEIKLQWTLRPPQTSYTGTLNLQIYVMGDNFKWETVANSVDIMRSLDGKPVVPTTPSILDSFIKEVSALVDNAKQSEENAKASEDIVKAYEVSSAESASLASASQIASKESEINSDKNAKSALASAETATAKATEVENNALSALDSKNSAAASETISTEKAADATAQSTKAQSYAVGGTSSRDGEDTDNAKFYAGKAEAAKVDAESSKNIATEKATAAANSETVTVQKAAEAGASAALAVEKAGEAGQSADSALLEANRAKSEADRASAIVGNLGWFANPESLKAAHPIGQNGWFATVGTTDSLWIWDSDTFGWVDSQNKGGGDYNQIVNKPQINGVTLQGDKSLADLGIQGVGDYATNTALSVGLAGKQEVGDYATSAALTNLDNKKADKATTLAGYGITDGATKTEVNLKAPIASPAFTGTPTAPTVPVETNNTQLATTAFVQAVKETIDGLITFDHSKSGTTHVMTRRTKKTGLVSAKFKATAAFVSGDRFNVDGAIYTAKLTNGETPSNNLFVSGVVVECVLDTESRTINFKSGGGKGYGTLPSQSGIVLRNVSGGVQITITRPNAENYAGTMVVRKVGGYPNSPSDGLQIDVGGATAYTDTTVTVGTTYFYRAFAYNADKEYQTLVQGAQVNIKYVNGILLSSLPIGALVKDTQTKYYDAPIIWKIVDKNHSGYPSGAITLMTDKIISLKCFDAMEAANGDSNRRSYGNNRYIYSNARRWLNSNAAAGGWYAAQHGQDAPPNNNNVWSNYNEYDAEAGFLYGFSANMRAALLDTTHTVGKSSTDGGGTETCVDKIFFPSCTEVGLSGDHVCGVKLAAFSTDASRQAYPTAECVSKSDYTSSSFNASAFWYYWLSDAYASISYGVRFVTSSGALNYNYAYYGSRGVRPLCNLKSGILVSETPDPDGAYIIKF